MFTLAALAEGQYELSYLNRSILFGRGTPYAIKQLELGSPDQNNNDYQSPRADGIGFGRDYRGGRVLTWEGNILARTTRAERAAGVTPRAKVAAALEQIETTWDAEEIRLQPELVTTLRMRRGGSTRRVYGRPRRFDPTTGNTYQGWIPLVCDFQCRDHVYYDDAEQLLSVGMVPDAIGGLVAPLIGPVIASPVGAGRQAFTVGGTKPCWPVFRVHGPSVGSITDPQVEIAGQWSFTLRGSIGSFESVIVDSTPWNRGIVRSDGANWGGKLSTTSQRPSAMRIPPGTHTVILRGNDSSRTAQVDIYWRDVYGSHV